MRMERNRGRGGKCGKWGCQKLYDGSNLNSVFAIAK